MNALLITFYSTHESRFASRNIRTGINVMEEEEKASKQASKKHTNTHTHMRAQVHTPPPQSTS